MEIVEMIGVLQREEFGAVEALQSLRHVLEKFWVFLPFSVRPAEHDGRYTTILIRKEKTSAFKCSPQTQAPSCWKFDCPTPVLYSHLYVAYAATWFSTSSGKPQSCSATGISEIVATLLYECNVASFKVAIILT